MQIDLGKFKIGDSHPVFIVAEVGINHNGDLELAKRQIDAAKEAGADSVKFQSYRTEDFITDKSVTYDYVSQGQKVTESQYEMFKRCELSPDEFRQLKKYCDEQEILFHSTPTSEQGIEDLKQMGVRVLKNGSDLLSHPRVVAAMGRSGIPTVLSTGMATMSEVEEAVQIYEQAGGKNLILLQCTSSYPAPLDQVNLRRMLKFKERFGGLVGFSDHTEGSVAAIVAVSLGAHWIEKHFTLDRNLPGPDHGMSMDPKQFQAFVSDIRNAESALGDSGVEVTESEAKNRSSCRLSCVAARDLVAGDKIEFDDIDYHRPATGLHPRERHKFIGNELKLDIQKGQQLKWSDFDE